MASNTTPTPTPIPLCPVCGAELHPHMWGCDSCARGEVPIPKPLPVKGERKEFCPREPGIEVVIHELPSEAGGDCCEWCCSDCPVGWGVNIKK